MNDIGRYRILIGGEWTLEDLYVFPRAFEQVYFGVYSLMPGHDEQALERINYAYRAFPWQGGYSAVNFYNQLKYVTPPSQRPMIVAIRYESPGWIDLALILAVACSAQKLITAIATTIREANNTYGSVVRGLHERKLLRLEVRRKKLQFKKEELEFIEHAARTMGRLLGFSSLREIHQRTGHSYITLKILLSLYRRVRTIAQYLDTGKAKFRGGRYL